MPLLLLVLPSGIIRRHIRIAFIRSTDHRQLWLLFESYRVLRSILAEMLVKPLQISSVGNVTL